MTDSSPIKLRLPLQDLTTFSSFSLEPEAAQAWAEGLPVTNTRGVVQQLTHALQELNRVELAPHQRFLILEALRPAFNTALHSLSKRILNQPLVMPEEPRQLADMADRLLGLTAIAYSLTAVHALRARDTLADINPARLVCESLYRALDFSGRRILLTFQLYQPVELNSWRTLHQLYSLAERQGLDDLPVTDDNGHGTSITAAYLQPLMLACCKPNQLRQADLAGIYRGLMEWSELVSIGGPELAGALFRVDMDADRPPMYSTILGEPGPLSRFIDTERLVAHLEQRKQIDRSMRQKGIVFDRETVIPANMVDHLIAALGTASQRNFSRAPNSGKLRISVGLSNTHFHVAGGQTLEQLLYGADYVAAAGDRIATNPFLRVEQKRDTWEEANPDDDYAEEVTDASYGEIDLAHRIDLDPESLAELQGEDREPSPGERYPVFRAVVVNTSPGGYCISWPAGLPPGIRTGDIAAVLEEGQKHWLVAVIRWISQVKDGNSLAGLELLSPRATPYAARITQKTGEQSDPMRVLLLPEIKLVGKPHTLVTPRTGFREKQKIVLLKKDEEFLVQLTRQVAATATFLQFDFRYIRQLDQGTPVLGEQKKQPEPRFDSLWNDL